MERRTLGVGTAALAVAGSMVGTGVFTTTGYLLDDIGPPVGVLLAWVTGGGVALAGALCYAELGAAHPHNGGEYRLLGRVFHPFLGFLAGWSSIVVGFGAPIAASGLTFGNYVRAASPVELPDARVFAVALILAAALAHAFRVHVGARALVVVAGLQLSAVGLLTVGGLAMGDPGRLAGGAPLGPALASPGFAVGLVLVGYAYAGWNAAAYIAGELERPERTLPIGLTAGTLLVTVLYVGINAAMLMSAPAADLAGRMEVAHVAATALVGAGAGAVLSGVIAFGQVGFTLAALLTGSRVAEAIGRDHAALTFLVRRSPSHGPGAALALLALLATVIGVFAAFDALLTWAGFVLSLFAAVTVLGVPYSRWREPELARPFRVPGGPWLVPLVFLLPTGWSIAHTLIQLPLAALGGLVTLGTGAVLWALVRERQPGS